jgi:hypothetical protein
MFLVCIAFCSARAARQAISRGNIYCDLWRALQGFESFHCSKGGNASLSQRFNSGASPLSMIS